MSYMSDHHNTPLLNRSESYESNCLENCNSLWGTCPKMMLRRVPVRLNVLHNREHH